MRKISNSEEVNQFYKSINQYIDEYINNWKISATKLKRYFESTKNMNNFLKKYKIDDIEGIKRIVKDVIDDRFHMEKDGIMKFENFLLSEKIKFEAIGMNHERVLADLYNTSVGHIEPSNSDLHEYFVNDFGDKLKVIIFSKEDVDLFKLECSKSISLSVKKKILNLKEFKIEDKTISSLFKFNLGEIIDNRLLSEKVTSELNDEKVLELFTTYINALLESEYAYKREFSGYYIWES